MTMKARKISWIFLLGAFICAGCGGEGGPGDTFDLKSGETSAEEFTANYYEGKGGYVISDYRGDATEVWIPDQITQNGITAPVVEIGEYCFARRANLKSVYLCDSVRLIDRFAFLDSGLTYLYTTPFLLSYAEDAFTNSNLKFFEKDGVSYLPGRLGKYGYAMAFKGEENATVNLPEECEAVYDNVFTLNQTIVGTANLKAFGGISQTAHYQMSWSTHSREITKVGDNAFYGAKNLESLHLAAPYSWIGQGAFANSSLSSIKVPDTISRIGDRAFASCASLTLFDVEKKEIPPESRAARTGAIGSEVFTHCSSLKTAHIPSFVSTMGSIVFFECENLYDIYYQFYDVEDFIALSGQNFYGARVHLLTRDGQEITEITVPSSFKELKEYAFSGCCYLTSITLSDSVETIGQFAFAFCSALVHVDLGNGLKTIGLYAFHECPKLAEVVIPASVSKVDYWLFSRATIERVHIPAWYAGSYGATKIKELAITGSGEIADAAFKGDTAVESVIIEGASVIGEYAFMGSAIVTCVLPSGLSQIKSEAFENCDNLTKIFIPASVTKMGWWAFSGCLNTRIYCEAEKQPSTWNSQWNPNHCYVTWGASGLPE